MHRDGGPFGSGYRQVTIGLPTVTPMVRALMIACGATWVGQWVFVRGIGVALEPWLGLVPALVVRGFVWQPFTYMFLHSPTSLFHILFNMLFLWMLGGELERAFGSRMFLRYYLTTGVGAAAFAIVAGFVSGHAGVPTVGASGAIFGLIVAYGMVFGNRTILFMMIFPMKARTFAIIMAVMALFNTVNHPGSGISDVAHLGGAVTGFLYLKRAWRLGPFLADLRWKLRRRRFRVMDRRDDDYPFH